MALKTLMLRRSIDKKKAELEALREKDADFATREADLEAAIGEAETDEDEKAVSEEIEQFEADKKAHNDAISTLSTEIDGLESQLTEAEQNTPVKSQAEPKEGRAEKKDHQERMSIMEKKMEIRDLPINARAFDAIPAERRAAIMQQPDVKEFLERFRQMGREQRAVTGGDLTIPVVFLDLIAENMYRYSKLLNRVRVRNVRGQARQTIAGIAPEAVWTEMCGAINELTFGFGQIVTDGYKVAGYIPVCNSLLEDSDVDLSGWVVEMLSEALGIAVDKAIVYGRGAASKMPLGIVPRLAQTAAPADYPATAPAWVDLHTTNVIQLDSALTGADFISALMMATGNTYNRYARGRQFWAMNSKTYAVLRSKMILATAQGSYVSNVFGTLPIIDGDIDILEFMPDGDIVGGYGDLYLWAQRSGVAIEYDRSVQFIQDNTVFRGKERADGQPIIPQAFVAININGQAVTTAMTFAADVANDAMLDGLTIGTETLAPAFNGGVYTYAITAANASDKVEATPAQPNAQVAISYGGKNVRNGGTVTWATGTQSLTVTVKQGNATRVYTVNVTSAAAGG